MDIVYEFPVYPYGRCVNLGAEFRKKQKFDYKIFSILQQSNSADDHRVQVFFSHPVTGAWIIPKDFELIGDSIRTKIKPGNLFSKFKTKIRKFDNVEGDPHFECRNYNENETYNDCIEKELMEKFHRLVGCHPPLISRVEDKMCRKMFNLSKLDPSVVEIGNIVEHMVNDFESDSCKQPCVQYQYQTKLLYRQKFDQKENQIKIVFDQTVAVTKTSFLIGVTDLLTGIGGAISFGRTLLWIIVSSVGLVKIIQKIIILGKNDYLENLWSEK